MDVVHVFMSSFSETADVNITGSIIYLQILVGVCSLVCARTFVFVHASGLNSAVRDT